MSPMKAGLDLSKSTDMALGSGAGEVAIASSITRRGTSDDISHLSELARSPPIRENIVGPPNSVNSKSTSVAAGISGAWSDLGTP